MQPEFPIDPRTGAPLDPGSLGDNVLAFKPRMTTEEAMAAILKGIGGGGYGG
jgi:hypothetical protein